MVDTAQVPPYPAAFRNLEIATNGTTLHVRIGGQGSAVLCLHGYGETGDIWAPLAAAPDSPLPPFEDSIDAMWIVAGPALLFLAGVYWLFGWFQSRRAGQEKRLVAEGLLVGAELLSVKFYAGYENNPPNLRVKFKMVLPDGGTAEGKQSVPALAFTRKNLPTVGSKLLVLRVDDSLQQVL
jgi:hypothetical protein